MIRTALYWGEAFLEWVINNPTADTNIAIDQVDARLYLNMAVESFMTQKMAGKFPDVMFSSFAVPVQVPVTGCESNLPYSPALGMHGIVSVSKDGFVYHPTEGLRRYLAAQVMATSEAPTWELQEKTLIWRPYSPSDSVEVLMVPNVTDLSNNDPYGLPLGAQDYIFATALNFAVQKLSMKTPLRNDTRPDISIGKPAN